MTRRPISFTIDPSLLARIDRLAELRGETRTAVIERAIRNDLAEQEDMVASMANPIVRAVYDQLLRSPKALKAIAAVVGESFSEEQLQGMQRAADSLKAAGERVQSERRTGGSGEKRAARTA